jgi:hypothetical protein
LEKIFLRKMENKSKKIVSRKKKKMKKNFRNK